MSPHSPFKLLDDLNRLEAGRVPQRHGQRRFQRFLVRADAELHPMDPSQLNRTPLEIKLRDISRGGAGFISQVPLTPGSCWRVVFLHRRYAIGQQALIVRHCQQVNGRDGIYLIGGQFCVDTSVFALLGIDPARVNEYDGADGDPDDAFLPPQDVDQ